LPAKESFRHFAFFKDPDDETDDGETRSAVVRGNALSAAPGGNGFALGALAAVMVLVGISRVPKK
jgi:hypothetical protein